MCDPIIQRGKRVISHALSICRLLLFTLFDGLKNARNAKTLINDKKICSVTAGFTFTLWESSLHLSYGSGTGQTTVNRSEVTLNGINLKILEKCWLYPIIFSCVKINVFRFETLNACQVR